MEDFFNSLLVDNVDLYHKHFKNNKRNINKVNDIVDLSLKDQKITLNIGEKISQEIFITKDIDNSNTKEIKEIKEINEKNINLYESMIDDLENIENYNHIKNNIIKNKRIEKEQINKLNKLNLNDTFIDKIKVTQKTIIIKNVFEYLFNLFYKYDLVYDNLFEIISSYNKDDFVYKNKANEIDILVFLKKLRSGSLELNLNLLAFELGNYNYNFFIENISSDIIHTKKTNEFFEDIKDFYQGTSNDLALLEAFNEIVIADTSGKIIFEEKKESIKEKQKEEQKEEKIIKETKAKFSFKPFKIKK